MKIAFLTVHNATSYRKVDFHFWSDVMIDAGINVDFVTVGFSHFTKFKVRGRRYSGPFNRWILVESVGGAKHGVKRKYLWRAPFHPMGMSTFFNKLLDPIFSLYDRMMPGNLLSGLVGTDIFVVENGAGLMLVPRLRKQFPEARFIYNVCDRIETLGYHPSIPRAEKAALPLFNKIRVPAQVMVEDFAKFNKRCAYIPHGLQKEAFDHAGVSPYETVRNVISVGDMLFDERSVKILAEAFPDWTFHLFGKQAKVYSAFSNIVMHGERPFDEIIPYICHADIGLAPYRPAPNADYLSQSSMKMIQYTYCRLPIIAPHFAAEGRAHVCPYEPGNANSLTHAMHSAIAYDRTLIDTSEVMGWEETVSSLLSFDNVIGEAHQ